MVDEKAAFARQAGRSLSPAIVLVAGFAGLIVAGTALLMVPTASASSVWTPPLVAFFTATSAVCVTGLVVVDTGSYWSPFGQAVILVLIQVGGLGFMTTTTLLLTILVRNRTSLRDRVLLQAATGEPQLGGVTALLRRVAVFAVAAEVVGAIVIGVSLALSGASPERAAWWGVF